MDVAKNYPFGNGGRRPAHMGVVKPEPGQAQDDRERG